MLANYYTLRHIAADLERRWAGRIIVSFFSQERNLLAIATDGDETLLVSCEPSANTLYCRTGYTRARKNTLELFTQCSGRVLRSVSIHPSDRELSLVFDDNPRVILQLYGSKANVYAVDQDRKVLAAFLRPKDAVGSTLEEPRALPSLPGSEPELSEALLSVEAASVAAAIRRVHPLMGPLATRELVFRSNVNGQAAPNDLSAAEEEVLFTEFRRLLAELTGPPSPSVYYKGSLPTVFSIIALRHLGDTKVETFDSIHQAIQAFVSSSRRGRQLLSEQERVTERLKKEAAKIRRTLEKVENETESADRADWYELAGKLLMASLTEIRKGMNSVGLENTFSPEREAVMIPLDIHLTPVKNAERYFEKSRKTRHSIEEQQERVRGMKQRARRLQLLLDRMEGIGSMDEWKQFADEYREALEEEGIVLKGGKVQEKETVPFRVFTVDGGFQVWAGKNSENNDLLTLRHARPNDLWFHARGSGGSHVVLRLGTGKGEVSKRAREQAASIAAYYSKMKHASLVPVAMTEKKYVRKPRGARAGTVMVEREKVLMVPPRLPNPESE